MWKRNLLFLLIMGVLVFLIAAVYLTTYRPAGGVKLETVIIRPPREVSALAVSGDTVWAGGQDGVYRIDRLTGTVEEKLAGGPPMEYVKALLVDNQGLLWIAHFQGLTCYDGKEFITYNENNGLPDRRVNSLMLDRAGRLWAGTWGGAACREGGSWRVITRQDGLADDMVNVILEDRNGGLWFGSYVAPRGGLSYFDGSRWSVFTTRDVLPHNGVCELMEDNVGRVWAGTGFYDQGGAAYCTLTDGGPGDWQVLRKSDGLAGEKVRSIFQDRDGVYWIGSEYEGVLRWDGDSRQVLTEREGLSGNEIKDWLQDEDGSFWLASENGVTLFRQKALVDWLKANG